MLLNNHSEVFNSYILAARENPVLSMLDMIFHKQMQRILSKQMEAAKWHGRICPKIKKKLEKYHEWSLNCIVKPGGDHKFSVQSMELERAYFVDLKVKSCDCKRWQLTGIPCHHAIACCRVDRINPENLVHSCYTVDTYNRAYAFNLVPLRGRVFWEKVDAVQVHPPLFTKVMGRPKKNRRKAPEEKTKKGVQVFTKAGVTIHCSVCGGADHNKRGHIKFMQRQMQQQQEGISGEAEDHDVPEIMLVSKIVLLHTCIATLTHTHLHRHTCIATVALAHLHTCIATLTHTHTHTHNFSTSRHLLVYKHYLDQHTHTHSLSLSPRPTRASAS
jgi:hypothetical protein